METPTCNIDELDEKILSILDQDSRLGYTQIAKILKKSHTTIKKRLDELQRLKIIKKYTIDIDFEKIGYEIVAIIEVSIAKGKLLEVQQLIASHPNVFGVYDVTGDYDSIILMRFKSRTELSKIIKKILKSPDVIRTNTHIALTVIKDNVDFDKMIKSQKWQEWSEWKENNNNGQNSEELDDIKIDPSEILTDIKVESQLSKSKKKE